MEYHRVNFDKKDLKNWTVIYFTPLPTCNNKTTCESCLAKDDNLQVRFKTNRIVLFTTPRIPDGEVVRAWCSLLQCQWCDNRCSNGYDRKRQEWMKKDCDKRKVNETKFCHVANTTKISTTGAHRTGGLKCTPARLRNMKLIWFWCVSITYSRSSLAREV